VPDAELVTRDEMQEIIDGSSHISAGGIDLDDDGAKPKWALAVTICRNGQPKHVYYVDVYDGRYVLWDRLGGMVAYEINRSSQCLDRSLYEEDWRTLINENLAIARQWAEVYDPSQLVVIDAFEDWFAQH